MITISGLADLTAYATALPEELNKASNEGLRIGGELAKGGIQGAINRWHATGTKTPSAPGTPPASISGDLSRSVETEGPSLVGGYSYVVKIGPTAPYGRVQELGGMVGRGVMLPSRPYVEPATGIVADLVLGVLTEMWAAAVKA